MLKIYLQNLDIQTPIYPFSEASKNSIFRILVNHNTFLRKNIRREFIKYKKKISKHTSNRFQRSVRMNLVRPTICMEFKANDDCIGVICMCIGMVHVREIRVYFLFFNRLC